MRLDNTPNTIAHNYPIGTLKTMTIYITYRKTNILHTVSLVAGNITVCKSKNKRPRLLVTVHILLLRVSAHVKPCTLVLLAETARVVAQGGLRDVRNSKFLRRWRSLRATMERCDGSRDQRKYVQRFIDGESCSHSYQPSHPPPPPPPPQLRLDEAHESSALFCEQHVSRGNTLGHLIRTLAFLCSSYHSIPLIFCRNLSGSFRLPRRTSSSTRLG